MLFRSVLCRIFSKEAKDSKSNMSAHDGIVVYLTSLLSKKDFLVSKLLITSQEDITPLFCRFLGIRQLNFCYSILSIIKSQDLYSILILDNKNKRGLIPRIGRIGGLCPLEKLLTVC